MIRQRVSWVVAVKQGERGVVARDHELVVRTHCTRCKKGLGNCERRGRVR